MYNAPIGLGVMMQSISLSIEFMIARFIEPGIGFCYTFILFQWNFLTYTFSCIPIYVEKCVSLTKNSLSNLGPHIFQLKILSLVPPTDLCICKGSEFSLYLVTLAFNTHLFQYIFFVVSLFSVQSCHGMTYFCWALPSTC